MISVIRSRKRPCLRLDDEVNVKFVNYSEEDTERFWIANLQQWRSVKFRPSNSLQVRDEILNPVIGTIAQESNSKKSIGAIRRSLEEVCQLVGLTSMLQDQALTAQTSANKSISDRGIPLPPHQVLTIFRDDCATANHILSNARAQMQKEVQEQKLFREGVEELRRKWRLQKLTNGFVSVDCSFASVGDANSLREDASLCPLSIGRTGPVISTLELSRKLKTLRVAIVHTATSSPIEMTTAWDLLPKIRPDPNIDSDTNLERHLRKRQHDVFCRRLFSHLKVELQEICEKWAIGRPWASNPSPLSPSPLTPHASGITTHLGPDCVGGAGGALLLEDALLDSVNVVFLERKSFAIKLSSQLSLVFTLAEIDETESLPAQDGHQSKANDELKWARRSLGIALIHAQRELLHHIQTKTTAPGAAAAPPPGAAGALPGARRHPVGTGVQGGVSTSVPRQGRVLRKLLSTLKEKIFHHRFRQIVGAVQECLPTFLPLGVELDGDGEIHVAMVSAGGARCEGGSDGNFVAPLGAHGRSSAQSVRSRYVRYLSRSLVGNALDPIHTPPVELRRKLHDMAAGALVKVMMDAALERGGALHLQQIGGAVFNINLNIDGAVAAEAASAASIMRTRSRTMMMEATFDKRSVSPQWRSPTPSPSPSPSAPLQLAITFPPSDAARRGDKLCQSLERALGTAVNVRAGAWAVDGGAIILLPVHDWADEGAFDLMGSALVDALIACSQNE